jgi:guanyl-specific ribonuclease Sa
MYNNNRHGRTRLPDKTNQGNEINYYEYDVDEPALGIGRNDRRLIIGRVRGMYGPVVCIYYTPDHYQSFIRMS